jgi:hypothetical protein
MRIFFSGGKEEYEKFVKIYDVCGSDPILRNTLEFNDLTIPEAQENGW